SLPQPLPERLGLRSRAGVRNWRTGREHRHLASVRDRKRQADALRQDQGHCEPQIQTSAGSRLLAQAGKVRALYRRRHRILPEQDRRDVGQVAGAGNHSAPERNRSRINPPAPQGGGFFIYRQGVLSEKRRPIPTIPQEHAYGHECDLCSSTKPKIVNRWLQMCACIIAMMAIANLQYAWTLFTNPLTLSLHATLAAVQIAF